MVLALQASEAIHLGVGILNVVRQVGRLLDGVRSSRPAESVNDGGLIIMICKILELRESDTARVTKVKGHADEEMVQFVPVQELDRLGNNASDEAADCGRRRVDPTVF